MSFSSSAFRGFSNALINKWGINDFSFYSGFKAGPIGMYAEGSKVLIEHYVLWTRVLIPLQ